MEESTTKTTNHIYGGFWRRFAAAIVDMIYYIPILALAKFLESQSIATAVFFTTIAGMAFVVYKVYFHYKFGTTIGKAVFNLKVTRPNGGKISFLHALKRSILDIFFAVLFTYGYAEAFLRVDPEIFFYADPIGRAIHYSSLLPQWFTLASLVFDAWLIVSFLVILLDSQKRSIHDMIGETIVIRMTSSK